MSNRQNAFSCIDLFSGCGGNSWGFSRAGGRVALRPVLAIDIDPTAIATYRRNMPTVEAVRADVRLVEPSFLLRTIGMSRGELGCLVASPPCQTYSRNSRLPRDHQDHRNTLYQHTLRIVKGLRPLTIFMENVPEMATTRGGTYHDDFLSGLERLGYVVRYWIVNAADYGVPQMRPRLIYLGYRNDMGAEPNCPDREYGPHRGTKPWVTVEEAIGDLPARVAGDGPAWFVADGPQLARRSQYAASLAPTSVPIVANHESRPLSRLQLSRVRHLEEGEGLDNLPKRLRPSQGYAASYGRLWRSKPSPTLTTYMAYPSAGRFSHYEQDRVITVREGLRLQSFHDDFVVLGNLSQQSSQVGNAVPPLLASAFGREITNAIHKYLSRVSRLPRRK